MKVELINNNGNHQIGNMVISDDKKTLGFRRGYNLWGISLKANDGTFLRGADGSFYLDYMNSVDLEIQGITDLFEVKLNLIAKGEEFGTYRITKSNPKTLKLTPDYLQPHFEGLMTFDIVSVGEPLK